jgi:DNA-binding response OmpR family regulator
MAARAAGTRVLLVEDDAKIASLVVTGLQHAGYAVDHATTGEDAMTFALAAPYDAAIVDVMLPGLDGLTVIERLRGHDVWTPVIIVSARRSVDDRVKGLDAGGDDYLTKPFAFTELMARLHALLRREQRAAQPTQLCVGDLTMQLLSREVTRGGRRLDLQPREFSLLEYLARNAGRPVSKAMILQHVWDYDFDPQTNVVEVLVSRLRSKVDEGAASKLIQTIRGVGYVLRES